MSSPATQYVYIPNLVGRQMLRIPLDEVEAEGQISIPTTQTTTSSPPSAYTRDSSPSPSVESVEETE
ncbi:Nn.00g113650.m01.CDS01 [Neocucurbitaria sp. VM-36]